MKRREFLKALAITLAAPSVTIKTLTGIYEIVPHTEAQKHVKGFELGKDIEITEMGLEYRGNYKVLTYQLRKRYAVGEDLFAYCEIDKGLIDVVPDPQAFITQELEAFVEAMIMEAKGRLS